MKNKFVLLIYGGNGPEHQVSGMSVKFFEETLKKLDTKFETLELKDNYSNLLMDYIKSNTKKISFVIPCIHGVPGESGDIQSILEMANLPYLGSDSYSSQICFNKVTSKLYFSALGIPNTPYEFLSCPDKKNLNNALSFMDKYGEIFVKASSQGSSIGCYKTSDKAQLETTLHHAFTLSPYVLIEKVIKGRELEVSVFEYENEIRSSYPGEIITPCDSFYSYSEKYNDASKTETITHAKNLPENISLKIMEYAIFAFKSLHLKHLSRIDFFLTDSNEIYLNEINTFPGMTPISMFPKMLEASGIPFEKFLAYILNI